MCKCACSAYIFLSRFNLFIHQTKVYACVCVRVSFNYMWQSLGVLFPFVLPFVMDIIMLYWTGYDYTHWIDTVNARLTWNWILHKLFNVHDSALAWLITKLFYFVFFFLVFVYTKDEHERERNTHIRVSLIGHNFHQTKCRTRIGKSCEVAFSKRLITIAVYFYSYSYTRLK